MTQQPLSAPQLAARPPSTSPAPSALETVWPDAPGAARRRTYAGAAATGAAAAVVLPDHVPGIGVVLVAVLAMTSVLLAGRSRWRPAELALGVVALALVGVAAVRDAEWLVVLCLAAAFGTGSLALSRATTWTGVALTSMAVPFAGLRGLPWLARGVQPVRSGGLTSAWPALRGAASAALLLLVFGALFAWADAAFARLLAAVTPDVELSSVPAQAVVGMLVAGFVLAASFLAVAQPAWRVLSPPAGRPAGRADWFVPIVALDLLFVAFVVLQLSRLFGGRDYVARTAGLTYAEYARSGFGQLVAVTLLTLLVIAVAARHAPRERASDATAARALLGALCLLALVVAGSALHRMDTYADAFGATRLRLLAASIEIWLVVVLLLVLVAGVRWSARWLPRAVVGSAAVMLLALAAVDADALVAERNVDRFSKGGALDTAYLAQLSADAVPVLDRLPEPMRSCALAGPALRLGSGAGSWAELNVSRERARRILAERPPQPCGPQARRAPARP